MRQEFVPGADGIYRCEAFQRFPWQEHGFGTRTANPPQAVTLRQIHSNKVWNANEPLDAGAEGDALITNRTGVRVAVRTADCVPILLLDSERRGVAAVHAGWRGTAARIVQHAMERLGADFGTDAQHVYAAIGPCIRECCYEVGHEVAGEFDARFVTPGAAGANPHSNPHLDLAAANRDQLRTAGVPDEHIFDSGFCTACDAERFFSYRREPGERGRLLSFISRIT